MFIQQRKRHRLSGQVTTHQHLDAPPDDDRAVRARSEPYSVPQQSGPGGSHSEAAALSSLLFPSAPSGVAAAPGSFMSAVGRGQDSMPLPVPAIVVSGNMPLGFNNSSNTNAAPAITGAKRAYQCRFCDMTLSSSSNRLRHERAKHHSQALETAPPAAQAESGGAAAAAAAGAFGISSNSDSASASAAQLMSDLTHVAAEVSASTGSRAEAHVHPELLPSLSLSADFNMDLDMDDSSVSSANSNSPQNHAAAAVAHELAVAAVAGAEADSELSSPAAATQLDDASPTTVLQPPPSTMDLSGIEGVSPSLQETELQAQCYPFLCWLTEPPLTPCEALVKARRIKSLTQLQPIKNTLRFIFALLYESGALKVPKLEVLSTLSVCRQLYGAMQARQVGHARLHAMFLLIKKILVFLSSQESAARRQFLLPSSVSESYLYVDGICSDSSFRRKQEARNRSLLGVAASRQLHQTQAAAAALVQSSSATGAGGSVDHTGGGFRVPQTWSTGAAPNIKLKDESAKPKPPRRAPANVKAAASSPPALFPGAQPVRAKAASTQPAAAAPSAAPSTANVSANEMSSAELQQVTQGCVHFLQQHSGNLFTQANPVAPIATETANSSNSDSAPAVHLGPLATADILAAAAISSNSELVSASPQQPGELASAAAATVDALDTHESASGPESTIRIVVADHVYMAYLVTALLCLCMAPRSQVLRQLRIGSSLVKEADGKYWVRLLADMCKNGKPTLFAVPELLTPIVDHYLQHVRPRLLARQPQMRSAAAAAASASEQAVHDYFFCKSNGTAPRTEFSTCSSLVTMQLLGRPVNAHAFRSAVITTFYRANASQADMDTLANIMSHDAATARNYYYRPAHMRAAEDASQRMIQQLLPAASAAADAASSSSTK